MLKPVWSWSSYPQQAAGPSKTGLARWLLILAGFGIVGRALVMAACGNRIAFADNLLNGGTASLDDANQADHLVSGADVISAVAFIAFHLVAVVLSIFATSAFKKNDSASAQDQLHGAIHSDWASIGINALVVAFLVVLVVVTRSEIAKARAAGTAA